MKDKGIVLIIGLLVIFIVSILVISTLALSMNRVKISRRRFEETQTSYLAEAGVKESLTRLSMSSSDENYIGDYSRDPNWTFKFDRFWDKDKRYYVTVIYKKDLSDLDGDGDSTEILSYDPRREEPVYPSDESPIYVVESLGQFKTVKKKVTAEISSHPFQFRLGNFTFLGIGDADFCDFIHSYETMDWVNPKGCEDYHLSPPPKFIASTKSIPEDVKSTGMLTLQNTLKLSEREIERLLNNPTVCNNTSIEPYGFTHLIGNYAYKPNVDGRGILLCSGNLEIGDAAEFRFRGFLFIEGDLIVGKDSKFWVLGSAVVKGDANYGANSSVVYLYSPETIEKTIDETFGEMGYQIIAWKEW